MRNLSSSRGAATPDRRGSAAGLGPNSQQHAKYKVEKINTRSITIAFAKSTSMVSQPGSYIHSGLLQVFCVATWIWGGIILLILEPISFLLWRWMTLRIWRNVIFTIPKLMEKANSGEMIILFSTRCPLFYLKSLRWWSSRFPASSFPPLLHRWSIVLCIIISLTTNVFIYIKSQPASKAWLTDLSTGHVETFGNAPPRVAAIRQVVIWISWLDLQITWVVSVWLLPLHYWSGPWRSWPWTRVRALPLVLKPSPLLAALPCRLGVRGSNSCRQLFDSWGEVGRAVERGGRKAACLRRAQPWGRIGGEE